MASVRYLVRPVVCQSQGRLCTLFCSFHFYTNKTNVTCNKLYFLLTYSKIGEENLAPLILDVGQHHQHADDHAEDDGHHHYQAAVNHLDQVILKLWKSFKIKLK